MGEIILKLYRGVSSRRYNFKFSKYTKIIILNIYIYNIKIIIIIINK